MRYRKRGVRRYRRGRTRMFRGRSRGTRQNQGWLVPRSITKGRVCWSTFALQTINYTAGTETDITLSFDNADMVNSDINGWGTCFDSYKVIRCYAEVWLIESDEETQANYVMPTMFKVYNPDNSVTDNAQNISHNPRHTMEIMRPGRVYKYSWVPKVKVTDSSGGKFVRGFGWRDFADRALTGPAIDSIQLAFVHGTQTATPFIHVRHHVKYAVRSIRNGQ